MNILSPLVLKVRRRRDFQYLGTKP